MFGLYLPKNSRQYTLAPLQTFMEHIEVLDDRVLHRLIVGYIRMPCTLPFLRR